jgi:SanA protein
MLKNRLDFGLEMYKLEKSDRIIVSGDNGKVTFDEVNAMRLYLESKGVPTEDIFMDHAGFNTYDSLYRARDVFKVNKAILVSQEYHLKRASYIAQRLGLETYSVPADTLLYPIMRYYRFREVGARVKAFLQAGIFKPKPKFLGDEIPVWKSGELTHDGKS